MLNITRTQLIQHFTQQQQILRLTETHIHNPGNLTIASVLVPIIDEKGELRVLFTERTLQLKNHAGQISFPGGRMEGHDKDLLETALRETQEETGIPPEKITVIGTMPTLISSTNFLVAPFIGLIEPPLTYQFDPIEVASSFTAPLNFLLDPSNQRQEIRSDTGKQHTIFYIDYDNRSIWGLTARILVTLGELLHTRSV